jgi:hypothetical protein
MPASKRPNRDAEQPRNKGGNSQLLSVGKGLHTPTREEIAKYCTALKRHVAAQQSVHEMVLSVANLCEEHHNNLKLDEPPAYYLAALWPGLAIIMEHLSDGDDEMKSQLEWMREKVEGPKPEPDGAR